MRREDRGRSAKDDGSPSLRVLPCACANLRRASRAVSRLYDEELRDAGLTTAQFTLLQVLSRVGEITQGGLGEVLVLDGTTLTRTLRTLEGRGWIRRREGRDRRERNVSLTSAGRSRYRLAVPAWRHAQALLRARVGRRSWSGLLAELSRIAGAAGSS